MKKPYPSLLGPAMLKAGLLFLMLCFAITAAQAQGGDEALPTDPMKKPEVWSELAGHPQDSVMWSRYISKPWACMNKQERDNIAKWQEEFSKALGQVVTEVKAHVDWNEPITKAEEAQKADEAIVRERERAEAELNAYISRLEETMVEESQLILDLKNNLAMNFFIIEELYAEEFRELGIEYETYLKTHPRGRYSKQLWIEEKEKELRKIKMKHFEQVRKEILKNARKSGYGSAASAVE